MAFSLDIRQEIRQVKFVTKTNLIKFSDYKKQCLFIGRTYMNGKRYGKSHPKFLYCWKYENAIFIQVLLKNFQSWIPCFYRDLNKKFCLLIVSSQTIQYLKLKCYHDEFKFKSSPANCPI